MIVIDDTLSRKVEDTLNLKPGYLSQCTEDDAWDAYEKLCDLEVELAMAEDSKATIIADLVDELYDALDE